MPAKGAKAQNRRRRAIPLKEDERLYSWLRDAGAPIGAAPTKGRTPSLEHVIARALQLAHYEARIALVLPIVLWRQRERLRFDPLMRAAARRREKRALGFFLELTGWLGMDARLIAAARAFYPGASTPTRFFRHGRGRWDMVACLTRSPEVARRWGYLMNMNTESFASAFTKHTAMDALRPR